MTIEGLNYINHMIESLGIPYEFMQWNTPGVSGTYWVGEYIDVGAVHEDGMEECKFLLTGTTNQKYLDLEEVKEKLKKHIGHEGITAILDSGSGVAVLYSGADPLPSVEYGIHRLQITLTVKEWRC